VLREDALPEEQPQFAGERGEELRVGLADPAVDGDEVGLDSLVVLVEVLAQPQHVALLAAVGWTRQDEAVADEPVLQLLDLLAQRHQDLRILVALAEVLQQLVQDIASRRCAHWPARRGGSPLRSALVHPRKHHHHYYYLAPNR
jgi:hypothetical protein